MKHVQANLTSILNWINQHSKKLLLGSLLLAAGLRIWGLDYGLPFIYHPDEAVPVIKAQTMLKTGDFNPHFFHWPSLIFYINTLVYSLHYLVGRLLGIFHTVADIPGPIMLAMGTGKMPMPSIWLASRTVTMIFGLGSVVLVFLSSKILTGKTTVGVLAGLLLAISPTNVAHSRYITPDMMASFLIMLSFYGSIQVWETGQSRYYILTGIATGLAISSKYNAVLILLVFFLAHFWRFGLKGVKKSGLYTTPLLAGIVFLASTPYAILDYPTFLTDLQFDGQHYSTGHPGMEGNTLNWYLSYLWHVEGIVFVLAIIEIVRGIFTRSKSTVLIALFPIIYFIFISSFIVRNARTLLPILPFIILLAANLSIWVVKKLSTQKISKTTPGLMIGAALAMLMLISFPLQKTIRQTVKLTTIDSRETARIWIADNLPHNTKVAIESYSPYLDPTQFTTTGIYGLKDNPLQWYEENEFDYLIFSEGSYGRFFRDPERYKNAIAEYEELWSQLYLEKLFKDGNYEIRIYAIQK